MHTFGSDFIIVINWAILNLFVTQTACTFIGTREFLSYRPRGGTSLYKPYRYVSPHWVEFLVWNTYTLSGADLGGGCRGCAPPPEMTCGFQINTVQSASQLYKICFIIWYVFSAVHIMLLPSRKPSYYYSLLKFVYVTSQLRHSLVVHRLLQKILDPPLTLPILVWNRVWFARELQECMNVFIVSIPHE